MRSPTSLTTDTVTVTAAAAAAAAAVGTELLQQHSINSIIEQRQDFLTATSPITTSPTTRHTTNDANTTLSNNTTVTTTTTALSTDTLNSTLNGKSWISQYLNFCKMFIINSSEKYFHILDHNLC